MKRIFSVLWAAALLPACGQTAGNAGDQNASEVDFITFGQGVSGLVGQVKQAKLNFCLAGVASGDKGVWEENIRTSVLRWVQPLRGLTTAKLTTQVTVNDNAQCNGSVVVRSGTHSNTEVRSNPVINMDSDGYFASFNVLLHEMGHGFALGDTYQNGVSGDCQPGQPQAVMCNTSFADLQKDDIKGITKVFKQTFPNDKPPTNPPDDPAKALAAYKLFAALGNDAGNDFYQLGVGLNGAEIKDAVMEFCLGKELDCRKSTSGWLALKRSGAKGDTTVFASDAGAVPASAGLNFTIRYRTVDKGTVYQAMSLAGGAA